MVPVARLIHCSQGRLRVKIASRKGNASYFSRLAGKLEELAGVESIQVNSRIGTALIIHACSVAQIAEHAGSEGLFQLEETHPSPQSVFENVADVVEACNKALRKFSGGRLDVPSLVFTAFVLSGAYQIMVGNLRAPAWYTAFWYALGVFSREYHGPSDQSRGREQVGGLFIDDDGGD